jgi:ribonucleoside-diphosphate reductase alpha chain
MAIDVTPSNGELESLPSHPRQGTTGASPEIQANAPGELRVIRRNGKVTQFRCQQDRGRDDQGLPRRRGRQRRGLPPGARPGSELTEQLAGTDPTQPGRRHRAHRGHPGPGRTGADALRRAQGRPRLCAVPRGKHANAPKRPPSAGTEQAETLVSVTLADGSTRPLDIQRLRRLVDEACAGSRRRRRVDPRRHLRNLFDGVKEKDVSQALVMSARA